MLSVSGDSFALFRHNGVAAGRDFESMFKLYKKCDALEVYDSSSGTFIKATLFEENIPSSGWYRVNFGRDGCVDLVADGPWDAVKPSSMGNFILVGGAVSQSNEIVSERLLWLNGCIAPCMRRMEDGLLVLELEKGCHPSVTEALKKYFIAFDPKEEEGVLRMYVMPPSGSMSSANPGKARIPEMAFTANMNGRLAFAAGVVDACSPAAFSRDGNIFIPARFPNRCMAHQAAAVLRSVLSATRILEDGLTVEILVNPYIALCLSEGALRRGYFTENRDLSCEFPKRDKADFQGVSPLEKEDGSKAYGIATESGSLDVNGVVLECGR